MKWKKGVLYHSVLLVRTDGQELRRRKRIRDRRVVNRLRRQLERRTDRLREGSKERRKGWGREGGRMLVKLEGASADPFAKPHSCLHLL